MSPKKRKKPVKKRSAKKAKKPLTLVEAVKTNQILVPKIQDLIDSLQTYDPAAPAEPPATPKLNKQIENLIEALDAGGYGDETPETLLEKIPAHRFENQTAQEKIASVRTDGIKEIAYVPGTGPRAGELIFVPDADTNDQQLADAIKKFYSENVKIVPPGPMVPIKTPTDEMWKTESRRDKIAFALVLVCLVLIGLISIFGP